MSRVEFFRSFYGRIEDTKKYLRNKLTFRRDVNLENQEVWNWLVYPP